MNTGEIEVRKITSKSLRENVQSTALKGWVLEPFWTQIWRRETYLWQSAIPANLVVAWLTNNSFYNINRDTFDRQGSFNQIRTQLIENYTSNMTLTV